jgi:hypothetical protein
MAGGVLPLMTHAEEGNMAKKKGKKDKPNKQRQNDLAGKQRPGMPPPPTAPVTADVTDAAASPRTKKKRKKG